MADDGPAFQSAPAAQHADDHDGKLNTQAPPMVSRKSTLTKSAFDYNITGYGGTDTPMTFGTNPRASKIMPDLDEYFVRPNCPETTAKGVGRMKANCGCCNRLAHEISKNTPNSHIGCKCTAASSHA